MCDQLSDVGVQF